PRNTAPTARIRRAGGEPRAAQDAGSLLCLGKLEDLFTGWLGANCVMLDCVGTAPAMAVLFARFPEYRVNYVPSEAGRPVPVMRGCDLRTVRPRKLEDLDLFTGWLGANYVMRDCVGTAPATGVSVVPSMRRIAVMSPEGRRLVPVMVRC